MVDLTFNEFPDIKFVKFPTITRNFTLAETANMEFVVPSRKIVFPAKIKLDSVVATQTLVVNTTVWDGTSVIDVVFAASAAPIFFTHAALAWSTGNNVIDSVVLRRKIVMNITSAVIAGDVTLELWGFVTDDPLQLYQGGAEAT